MAGAEEEEDARGEYDPAGEAALERSWPTEEPLLKWCDWSPDGVSIATAGEDGVLRLFDLPESDFSAEGEGEVGGAGELGPPGLEVPAGEAIRGWSWWPGASVINPSTWAIALACRGLPIRLVDGLTGGVRATYACRDGSESMPEVMSVAIGWDASALFAGLDGEVATFDPLRPGESCRRVSCWERVGRRRKGGQHGLIASIEPCPYPFQPSVAAAGSYGSDLVGVHDFRAGSPECLLLGGGHSGGVTCIRWSPCSTFLFSAARRDDRLLCWDVRSPGEAVAAVDFGIPGSPSNQRVLFTLAPGCRHLLSGSSCGAVLSAEIASASPVCSFGKFDETVSSCSVQPGGCLAAVTCGHRRPAPSSPSSSSSSAPADPEYPDEQGSRLGRGLYLFRLPLAGSPRLSDGAG